MSLALHQRYYAAAEGTWRGHATLKITSWRTFWGTGLSLSDRMALLGMALLEPVLGPTPLMTQVVCTDDPHRVEHLLELSRAGVCLFRGRRVLDLQPDGVSVTITGKESRAPRHRECDLDAGRATVTNGTTATYRMPANGQVWDVAMVVTGDDAASVIRCPWGHGTETLRRSG